MINGNQRVIVESDGEVTVNVFNICAPAGQDKVVVQVESTKEPEDVKTVVEEPEPSTGLFCRITKAAYNEGKAEQVDDDLRSASVSAPKLVRALNLNEALGYLDTKNLSSKDLYDLLDEQFDLKFGLDNFRKYRR